MSKARQLAQRTNQSGRKNLIINGAMNVAQRGTSFSHNGNITAYPVDRFLMIVYNTGFATPTGGTSAQVDLTDSDSESLGFSTAIRFTPASDSKLCYLSQKVEDVSRLAGKTITLSYYARVNTGTFTIPNEGRITQNFGSGGSSATNTFASFDDNVLTTSWKRISYSLTLPSVVGKTINAGNNTDVRTFHTADLSSLGWIEITGVQLEVGSVATEFEHRSFGEELALCQRYYQKSYAYGTAPGSVTTAGWIGSTLRLSDQQTGYVEGDPRFEQRMRTSPTITFYDRNGTVNRVNYYIGGSSVSNYTMTVTNNIDTGFSFYTDNTTTKGGVRFAYTADAEL